MNVPMRKKDREITDPAEIEKILNQGEIISVAMCQGDQALSWMCWRRTRRSLSTSSQMFS
jgi:nitroimidazol reductase NimA-like FMN-containing flavoprotein (pyridoxamine 5'-phosphate oxidase superfamily)